MILAAGLGTRLKPITDSRPKALVEVEGVPMLERIMLTLKRQGFTEIVVNVHHFADMIKDFIASKDFGVEVKISDEKDLLLDTGGGIVRAASLLFGDNDEPVLVHNVDILSNADLHAFMESSNKKPALLVSQRESARKLIFDDKMNLRGWHNLSTGEYRPNETELKSYSKEFAFSGIYTLTIEMAEEMKRLHGEGPFPVMDYFLNPKRREGIKGIAVQDLKLIDIGKPATLSQASEFINC